MPHLQEPDVARLVRREVQQRRPLAAHARGPPHPVHERRGILRRVELHHPVDARNIQAARRHVRAQQKRAVSRPRESRERRLALRLLHLAVERDHLTRTAFARSGVGIGRTVLRVGVRGSAGLQRRREVVHARARQEVRDHLLPPRLAAAQKLAQVPQALVHRADLVGQPELRGELPARGRGRDGRARGGGRLCRRLRRGVPHGHAHGVPQARAGELLGFLGLRGAEQAGAALFRQTRDDGVERLHESHAQQPVGLVEDQQLHASQVHRFAADHDIVQPAGRADERRGAKLREALGVGGGVGAADQQHRTRARRRFARLEKEPAQKRHKHVVYLPRQLSSGRDHDRAHGVLPEGRVRARQDLQQRQDERQRLARSGARLHRDVLVPGEQAYRRSLHRRRTLVALRLEHRETLLAKRGSEAIEPGAVRRALLRVLTREIRGGIVGGGGGHDDGRVARIRSTRRRLRPMARTRTVVQMKTSRRTVFWFPRTSAA